MKKSKKWDRRYVRVFSRHPSHNIIRNSIISPEYAVVRFGSTTPTIRPRPSIELNTVKSVENSMDKLKMKKVFQSAGVDTPKFFTLHPTNAGAYLEEGYRFISYEELYDLVRYPVLAKRTYRSRGAGMKKIDSYEELRSFIGTSVIDNNYNSRNPYYLEQYHNYTKEYRLHISELGRCFYTCRKMLKTDAQNRWYRNDENSVWILEKNELFDRPITWSNIVADCYTALQSIGLSLGAFDVRVAKDGRHKIIEVNSAPSFGDYTGLAYQNEINSIIQHKTGIIDV